MKRFLSVAFFAVALTITLAAAMLDLTFAIKRWIQIRSDDAPATTAMGNLVDQQRLGLSSISLMRGEHRYRVRYRFVTADGKNVEAADVITARHGFEPGEELQISYRKSDPLTNRIILAKETGDVIFRGVVALSIVAAVLFVLFILVYVNYSMLRVKRALEKQRIFERDATITQIDRDGAEAVVHFTFLDDQGFQRQASDAVDTGDVAKLNAGDTGKVFWDPQYPDEADWIG